MTDADACSSSVLSLEQYCMECCALVRLDVRLPDGHLLSTPILTCPCFGVTREASHHQHTRLPSCVAMRTQHS